MPLSRTRDYMSIGEVLETVRQDFPDVSISKIRFLESEGLLEPERTPSGYRKFFEKDVARLRYILSMQRDQFLPLKIIKERLASGGNGGAAPIATPTPPPAVEASGSGTGAAGQTMGNPTEVSMGPDELRTAAGLDEREFQGLVEFGILDRGKDVFDGDDLIAATAARGLFRYGVEPRHLKMYRNFVERESAFFEQIVSPVTHRRDPDSQKEAARSMQDLFGLAQRFRDALSRSSMREHL